VLAALPHALVVRTGPLFGPWDSRNPVADALVALQAGGRAVADESALVSPTYMPDLVHAALDLLVDGEHGVWHLANVGAVTLADLGRRAAELAGLDAGRVDGQRQGTGEPLQRVLASERGGIMPPLERALACFFADGGYTPVRREAA
jgi:dTDP-4-dehydrorhamnose reductase